MGFTKQELVDIIASQVQTVVMEKVQAFSDGWTNEFHKLAIEVKGSEEHNSLIISKLNEHETAFVHLQDTTEKVSKLFTMFFEDGFSERFTELQKAFQKFLENRVETCPVRIGKSKRQILPAQWIMFAVAIAALATTWLLRGVGK